MVSLVEREGGWEREGEEERGRGGERKREGEREGWGDLSLFQTCPLTTASYGRWLHGQSLFVLSESCKQYYGIDLFLSPQNHDHSLCATVG